MPQIIKAVFFDMDGVLVDSMKYHVAAWTRAFNEYGYYPDELDFYLNEGVKHPITVRDRLRALGIDQVDDEAVEKIFLLKRKIYDEITQLKPTPGVIELLDRLKGKTKLGLVTGGIPSVVKRVLMLFDNYFELVVDYESTPKGKPDPEPYLYAVKRAGVKADEVIVIENSPTGVASAMNAGTNCWAICTTLGPDYLKQAKRVFKDFAEIQKAMFSEEITLDKP
jgi:beta-phosphoglucomutase